MMKDNKYKIKIHDVYCDIKRSSTNLPPFDKSEDFYQQNPGFPPLKKSEQMMLELKRDMQLIINAYKKAMQDSSPQNEW